MQEIYYPIFYMLCLTVGVFLFSTLIRLKEKLKNFGDSIPNSKLIVDEISKTLKEDSPVSVLKGDFIKDNNKDERVLTLYNSKNLGVGGASMVGFKHARKLGADIIIKIDGDDQNGFKIVK